jgi:hypothetical protein
MQVVAITDKEKMTRQWSPPDFTLERSILQKRFHHDKNMLALGSSATDHAPLTHWIICLRAFCKPPALRLMKARFPLYQVQSITLVSGSNIHLPVDVPQPGPA